MTAGLGIEPATHWWKAGALTIMPNLLSEAKLVLCLAPTAFFPGAPIFLSHQKPNFDLLL